MKYNLWLLCCCSVLSVQIARAQSLTLEDCHRLAKENYPAVKKFGLIEQSATFTIENANKNYLPTVSFSGKATYQSQVINYADLLGNLSGISFPTYSKDQYTIAGEVDQNVYDGGSTRYQKEVVKASSELEKQNVEVQLYALNDRVNNLFFAILLLNAKLAQNETNKATLQSQAEKTQVALDNGTAYKSNVNELKAEIGNIDMASAEFAANRKAYLKMLSILIGKNIDSSAQLSPPQPPAYASGINRPELKMFDLQNSVYDAKEHQLKASYQPRLSAFFQGAYGRPTLNAISNDFGAYYIVGARLNWSLGSLYTLKNQRKLLQNNRLSADVDKETFLLGVKMDMANEDENIKKYRELVDKDKEIIVFRQSITQSASAQLSNGVITTHEYIQQVNAENAARQSLALHQIQLLQSQYNMQYKSGNK